MQKAYGRLNCCKVSFVNGSLRSIILSTFSEYTSLGCWRDKSARAIPKLDGTDPTLRDTYRTRRAAIDKCYKVAKERGLVLFAVQNGGQCFGSLSLNGYRYYGRSQRCRNGKGGPWANDVYKISDQGKNSFSVRHPPLPLQQSL